MNRFLDDIKGIKNEVFIDTIEAEGTTHTLIGQDFGWTHVSNGDYWTKAVYHKHCVVFLTFKAFAGEKGKLAKHGNMKVKFSVPKLQYNDNFTGVYCSDCPEICNTISMLLAENFAITEDCEFPDFKIVRVDRSICTNALTPERIKEILRLFSLLYFPYHKPGKRCSKEYNYKTSFCHTSASEDIICYDKSEEYKAHSKETGSIPPKKKGVKKSGKKPETTIPPKNPPSVADNILRLEISSKGNLQFYGDFGTVEHVLTSNKEFTDLIEYRNLHLDFAPKDEYWNLIKSCFDKEKEIYLSDPDRKSKDYPRYIKRNPKNVFSFLEYINRFGCCKAHEDNDELYNDCVDLTSKLGISVLYTKFDERINFFERFYRRADTDKIFLRTKPEEVILVDVDIPEYIDEMKKDFNKTIRKLASGLKSAKTILISKSTELLSSVYTKITYHKRE